MTIAKPASKATPTLLRSRPRMIGSPRPGASIRTVITTIAQGQHDRLVDRQTDDPAGERQLHLAGASAARSRPIDSAASTVAGGTRRIPRAVIRMAAGIA